MSQWTWGNLIWGVRWLLIGFLLFEIAAKDVTGLAPWPSLSKTWEHAIDAYKIGDVDVIGPLTFATFVFLCVHWIYRHPVWQSIAYGIVVAGVAHWLDHRL